MGFKVDFDALDTFHNNVATQANTWQDQLKQISSAVETLHVSQNMSGVGADSIRAYMEAVHSTLLATLSELISLHSINVLLYKNDYQQNIDTGLHAVIRQDELESISYTVERHRKKASEIFDDAVDALNKVKDIFYVSYRDVSDVDAAHISVKDFLQELGDEIVGLEGNHVNKDFEETGEMIRALKSFIQEQSATGRDYKTCFDPNSLAKSSAFRDLYSAHMRIQNNLNEKAPAIERAIGNEQERAVQIQEELERERAEREKKARIINWVVTGVCIVGSVVAIAATGGAATPLVVGAISAVSGATMAGTRNLTNQYVENGNLNNTDWGSFGKDVLVGGVTGFITGYAGAAVSGAITSGLSQTTIGNALLNSPNALVRIGSGAVIGSVSEIGSGIVSRGAGATVQGLLEGDLNLEDVKNQMFDGKSILIDGATGGVSGGIRAAKNKPKIHGSDWSEDITEHIDSDEQYDIYKKAELTEGEVNGRKALMKDIDYDYVDEKTGLTNRELMAKGRSPIDAKTGEKIELHHMGQGYDSPFAELCENSEHGDGNHSILHTKTENSWRNTPGLENNYQREKINYWKTRSRG